MTSDLPSASGSSGTSNAPGALSESSGERAATGLHHVPGAFEASRPVLPAGARAGMVRPVLWFLLLVSAVLTMVFSSVGADVLAGAGFGPAALACVAALIVHHYRCRRR
ncbi:hypothetical protein [Streptosporangium sp. NPDC048865]|uniref:hypothetical protein n=1 Tax=Streptosporangium sp. NPDC048865 TaxID=3155766 RepID=UPI0034476EF0